MGGISPPMSAGESLRLSAHGGLFDRFLLGLGPFELPSSAQALIAQDAQSFDLRSLAPTRGVFEHLDIFGSTHPVWILGFLLWAGHAPKHKEFANVLNGCSI